MFLSNSLYFAFSNHFICSALSRTYTLFFLLYHCYYYCYISIILLYYLVASLLFFLVSLIFIEW